MKKKLYCFDFLFLFQFLLVLFWIPSANAVIKYRSIEEVLREELKLKFPRGTIKKPQDLLFLVGKKKNSNSVSNGLNVTQIRPQSKGSSFLVLFESSNQGRGKYFIFDSNLNLVFSNTQAGTLVDLQKSDLFQVQEQNLIVTYSVSSLMGRWYVSDLFRVNKDGQMELFYRYYPKVSLNLSHLVPDSGTLDIRTQTSWVQGVLECESQLEWRKRSKYHSPDLTLVSSGQVKLNVKGLSSDEAKELAQFLKKRMNIGISQKQTAILDRIALDPEVNQPGYYVSYGVRYGDDPPFSKALCPVEGQNDRLF